LRQSHAAGRGAGPVKPSPAFALRSDNLPVLSLPGRSEFPRLQFAPLTQRDMGLYVIVDSAAWVERVVAAGVRTVQLRIKDAAAANLREEIRAAIAAADAADAQLFINDHWQLALEEGAYGVHLGQEDLATADLQALARAGVRLGISTHAYWEVCRAKALRPSYIACGPIHATAAKAMPWIPQGNGNLAYWCSVLAEPVVAIAGMDTVRARQARECGAAGVALISAVTAAADPEGVIAALQKVIDATGPQAGLDVPRLARSTLLLSSRT
jgi:hydroxymethylpyrimidine kinase/phosphomethylpyrimidine kinase/thiamine-phosphate diphosphorylase